MALLIPPIRRPVIIVSAVGFVIFVSISMILLIGDEHASSHSHYKHNNNGALGIIRRRLSEIDPFVERSEL